MDTSEAYIKMCRAAKEIQSLRAGKEEDGDWWYGTYPENCGYPKREQILVVGSSFHSGYIDNDYCSTFTPLVWLPRQDQLQEMLGEFSVDKLGDLVQWMQDPYGFGSWPFPREQAKLTKWNEYIKSLTAMEQLWLAFVMKEKYGKVWNGTEWVKEV